VRYGKWPHEVSALPFHYYLALRADWMKAHGHGNIGQSDEGEGDEFDFNADTLTGGLA